MSFKVSFYMAAKKLPFGGKTICFKDYADSTLGEVFGTKPITPSQMTSLIWKFVKAKSLMS